MASEPANSRRSVVIPTSRSLSAIKYMRMHILGGELPSWADAPEGRLDKMTAGRSAERAIDDRIMVLSIWSYMQITDQQMKSADCKNHERYGEVMSDELADELVCLRLHLQLIQASRCAAPSHFVLSQAHCPGCHLHIPRLKVFYECRQTTNHRATSGGLITVFIHFNSNCHACVALSNLPHIKSAPYQICPPDPPEFEFIEHSNTQDC